MPFGGERVEKSGIYLGFHVFHREDDERQVFVADSVFPYCPTCKDEVQYVLIEAAPNASELPAFNPEKPKHKGSSAA